MITKATVRKIVQEYFAADQEKYKRVIRDPIFDDSVMKARTKDEVESICFRYWFGCNKVFTPSEYASATVDKYYLEH